MRAATVAGGVYFVLVFAVGFALGSLRVLAVAPRLGETAAVALEAPLMLAASWLACGWCLRRFAVARTPGARAWMGGIAFAFLIGAELAMSAWLFGRSAGAFVAGYATAAGGIGLAAQAAFGLFPVGRLAVEGRRAPGTRG